MYTPHSIVERLLANQMAINILRPFYEKTFFIWRRCHSTWCGIFIHSHFLLFLSSNKGLETNDFIGYEKSMVVHNNHLPHARASLSEPSRPIPFNWKPRKWVGNKKQKWTRPMNLFLIAPRLNEKKIRQQFVVVVVVIIFMLFTTAVPIDAVLLFLCQNIDKITFFLSRPHLNKKII